MTIPGSHLFLLDDGLFSFAGIPMGGPIAVAWLCLALMALFLLLIWNPRAKPPQYACA